MVEVPLFQVSVVLPTYNEAASLPWLVPEILRALDAQNLRGEIIVVDDDSPDGTARVAEQLAEDLPVRVIRRTHERGLATAALAGLRASRATVCAVMDADGSHPVPDMMAMVQMVLDDKAEIVVGSRRVRGGGSRDWPLFSQLKSRAAASLALGLTAMTDPTTGMMAVRRSLLESLELDPVGWKIVLEVVVKAHPSRLAEYPIVFTDRTAGENKQNLAVLGLYLLHMYRLYNFRFPAAVELLKFYLVGLFGIFVDLSAVAAAKHLWGLDTRLCQIIGFSLAVTSNYALNRRFSFRQAKRVPLIASYAAYLGTNLVGLTLRMLTIHVLMLLTSLDQQHGYLLLSALGIGVASFANFLGAKYFAFAPRTKRPSSDRTESLFPSPSTQSGRSQLTQGWLAVALGALLVGALNLSPSAQRSATENANTQLAQEITNDLRAFLRPPQNLELERHAGGEAPSYVLPALRGTPLFPLLLSVATRIGPYGMALLPALVFAVFLSACLSGLRPLDRRAASAAVWLAASAPWIVAQFSQLVPEPLAAACAALGFALLVRSEGKLRLLFGFLAGVCVGLGFAVNLWLILPGLSACSMYLVARTYEGAQAERARWARTSLWFFVGFGLAALSHLAVIAVLSRGDLEPWLDSVYLALFYSARVEQTPRATPLASWNYALWLVRDHGALLAPLCLGMPALTRRMNVTKRAFSAAVFAALLALIPLSIPAAQNPLYMAPMLAFIYMLTALSLVSSQNLPHHYRRVNRSAARFSLAVAAALCVGWSISAVCNLTVWSSALGHLAHIAVWSVPSVWMLREKPLIPTLLPCAVTSFALAALLTAWGPHGLPQ